MSTRAVWPRSITLLGCAVALVSLGVVREAAAEEPTLDQVEYHPAELPPDGTRSRTILVGLALTAGWYGASVGTSYLWSDAPNAPDLRLPVVGPWMALGDVGCGSGESGCSTGIVIARTALAVVSGVGQAGGLFALVEGLVMDTGSKAPSPAREAPRQDASWSVAPVLSAGGAGFEFFGRF